MGVDTSGDGVYPDLAFARPNPEAPRGPTGVVGLGVMDYHGGYADRGRATRSTPTTSPPSPASPGWLIDEGVRVRVLIGDHGDEAAARAVVAGVRAAGPTSTTRPITAASPTTLTELQEEIARVDTVVATRFHNIICAVEQAKPTISLAYAAKNDDPHGVVRAHSGSRPRSR